MAASWVHEVHRLDSSQSAELLSGSNELDGKYGRDVRDNPMHGSTLLPLSPVTWRMGTNSTPERLACFNEVSWVLDRNIGALKLIASH